MDAISGSSAVPGVIPTLATPAVASGATSTTAFPATQASTSGCGAMHDPTTAGGGAVGAATGAASLTKPATSLASALQALTAAVDALKQAVTAFAQRIAAGNVAGGVGITGGGQAMVTQVGGTATGVQGGGPDPTNATARASAIPSIAPGQTEPLRLARGQVTYREIAVTGAAGGTTVPLPTTGAGVGVELYALRDYQKGAHSTQVLEPVTGPITVGAGETVKFVTRITAKASGDQSVNVAGATLNVHVGTQSIDALPMMAWVNESNASSRGASSANVASVLSHFGVAATGNSGVAVTSAANRSPVQYFSAAYQAATRQDPAQVAQTIIAAERKAQAANPGSKFWVQVSDEQDTSASQVSGTVDWIRQLKSQLAAQGSSAKLFVAAQAKPANLAYASVVDGWATTQSAAGKSRDSSISDIQRASAGYGRSIELMEYPGNAFFDAGTTGGAAVSTASAALDGASSWFLYSANNLDTLEQGRGDEGRGDIGGLVAIENGRVLPTIALIEAELGANLGSAARTFGGTGVAGSVEAQVSAPIDQLDAYRQGGAALDLRAWEAQIGSMIT
jgi:hypothetical protein